MERSSPIRSRVVASAGLVKVSDRPAASLRCMTDNLDYIYNQHDYFVCWLVVGWTSPGSYWRINWQLVLSIFVNYLWWEERKQAAIKQFSYIRGRYDCCWVTPLSSFCDHSRMPSTAEGLFLSKELLCRARSGYCMQISFNWMDGWTSEWASHRNPAGKLLQSTYVGTLWLSGQVKKEDNRLEWFITC